MTGENPIDVLGNDAENIVEEMGCEKCGGEMGNKMVGDESYKRCSDCGLISVS